MTILTNISGIEDLALNHLQIVKYLNFKLAISLSYKPIQGPDQLLYLLAYIITSHLVVDHQRTRMRNLLGFGHDHVRASFLANYEWNVLLVCVWCLESGDLVLHL